jgi:hypothetical protein
MRLAIATCEPRNDPGVQRVALVRPVDRDPERLRALLGDYAVVRHCSSRSLLCLKPICGWNCFLGKADPDGGLERCEKHNSIKWL